MLLHGICMVANVNASTEELTGRAKEQAAEGAKEAQRKAEDVKDQAARTAEDAKDKATR